MSTRSTIDWPDRRLPGTGDNPPPTRPSCGAWLDGLVRAAAGKERS
ncbi:hypothetical protein [Streptomyces sp. NPDC017958]